MLCTHSETSEARVCRPITIEIYSLYSLIWIRCYSESIVCFFHKRSSVTLIAILIYFYLFYSKNSSYHDHEIKVASNCVQWNTLIGDISHIEHSPSESLWKKTCFKETYLQGSYILRNFKHLLGEFSQIIIFLN